MGWGAPSNNILYTDFKQSHTHTHKHMHTQTFTHTNTQNTHIHTWHRHFTSKGLKVMGGVSLEHVALRGAETPRLRDSVLSTGCLILHGGEATGLVQSHEVQMGWFGEVWEQIKRRCLRIQDITAGKNFRKYLVQHLNLATEETQIESKPIGPK